MNNVSVYVDDFLFWTCHNDFIFVSFIDILTKFSSNIPP